MILKGIGALAIQPRTSQHGASAAAQDYYETTAVPASDLVAVTTRVE